MLLPPRRPVPPPNRMERGRPVMSEDRRREQEMMRAQLISNQRMSPDDLEEILKGKRVSEKPKKVYRDFLFVVKDSIAELYGELATYGDEWRVVTIQKTDHQYQAHLEKMISKEVKLSLS